jgi:carbonic anhydrase
LAVVHSCIDSRTPAELIFDLGLGDIFSIRIAGNVMSPKVLGSMEYGCAVAGAKLILVMGHTLCGAVAATVESTCSGTTPPNASDCQHLAPIMNDIRKSINGDFCDHLKGLSADNKPTAINEVAQRNVLHAVESILRQSHTIRYLVERGRIAVIGAMYDVTTGKIDFLSDVSDDLPEAQVAAVDSTP